jgi:hypothetical protein
MVDMRGVFQGAKIYSNIANASGAGLHLSTSGSVRVSKVLPLLRVTGGGANFNNNTVCARVAGRRKQRVRAHGLARRPQAPRPPPRPRPAPPARHSCARLEPSLLPVHCPRRRRGAARAAASTWPARLPAFMM